VVSATSNLSHTVCFQSLDTSGLIAPFGVAVAELAYVVLRRLGAPGVDITVLVENGTMVFSAVDLHDLHPRQRRDDSGLVVARPAKLQNGSIFQKAKCRVVIAGDLANLVLAELGKVLEFGQGSRVRVLAQLAVKFAT